MDNINEKKEFIETNDTPIPDPRFIDAETDPTITEENVDEKVATDAEDLAKFDGDETKENNILLDDFGIHCRENTQVLSEFCGDHCRIGKENDENIYVDRKSINIKKGNITLARFEGDKISLGENSKDATISFCDNKGEISCTVDGNMAFYNNQLYGTSNGVCMVPAKATETALTDEGLGVIKDINEKGETVGYKIYGVGSKIDLWSSSLTLNNNALIKYKEYSKKVTIAANEVIAVTMGAVPTTPLKMTMLGVIPVNNGYGDQWEITYSIYSNNVIAMIRSKYNSSLTSNIKCRLVYVNNAIISTI